MSHFFLWGTSHSRGLDIQSEIKRDVLIKGITRKTSLTLRESGAKLLFCFRFVFLTCFSVHLQSPHQPCVGMPSVGMHVCVCVCARDFATSLSTHLHLNLHPAPTSCDLPVSIMRLLCPISGHKEMLFFFFFTSEIIIVWL